MKPRSRLIALAFLAIAPLALAAETSKIDIDRVLSTAREENLAMDHLDYLTNRIGPRLTSSDGLQHACEWTRDRFKEFGIENARLEKWGEFPVGFNRGPWSGRMVEPTVKALTFGTNSWTAGTKGLVKGPAVMAPENDEQLAQVKDKLAGAWVLVPPGAAGQRGPGGGGGGGRPGGGQGGPAEEFRKKRDAAYAEAKIAGTVRGLANELIVTGGSYQITWDKLPTVPVINMVKSSFDEVAGLVKEGKPVVLEFDIRNYFKKGPIPLYNVIADIPGTEFPDEYVIVGGHIDSWDGATGTTDNGTGCATTLEAARLLMKSGVKPRRTIRFMLWSGEEQGLFGSREYVKAHPDLMKKISVVLVHDMGTNYLSGLGVTKAMKPDIDAALAPLVGLDPAMPFAIREVAGIRRGGGSDHDSFLSAGVPGLFWNQSGSARYNTTHHTQHDTFDRAVPEYQKHSSLVAALAALGIANLDHLLSRDAMIAPGGGRGGFGGRRVAGIMMEEMKITEVVPDGVAEKAGVKIGDVLVKVNGKAVATREEYMEAMQTAGREFPIVVKRDGKEVELKLAFPAPQPQP
jgi:carboxypeptidase Q